MQNMRKPILYIHNTHKKTNKTSEKFRTNSSPLKFQYLVCQKKVPGDKFTEFCVSVFHHNTESGDDNTSPYTGCPNKIGILKQM